MSKKQKIETKKDEPEEITIDYDNLDIQDIMNQIKAKIARAPESPTDPEDSPPAGNGHIPLFAPEPEKEGVKAKVKKILTKLMKPFAPIIKLLVYPVHKELMETTRKLDETNQRLDFYEKHLSDIRRAIDVVEAKTHNSISNTNDRIDKAFNDIHKIKEYTKLLHALSHNMVVEMSKLKIEEEYIKLKTRIMEKDFEFLGKKEQALEKEIYK